MRRAYSDGQFWVVVVSEYQYFAIAARAVEELPVWFLAWFATVLVYEMFIGEAMYHRPLSHADDSRLADYDDDM